MSKSQTKEYINKIYGSQFKVFSGMVHRTTKYNRSNTSWISCKNCIDIDTCKRIERESRLGCEAKVISQSPLHR